MAMAPQIEEMREAIKRVIYRRESNKIAESTLSRMCLTPQQKRCLAITNNAKVLEAIKKVNNINKKLDKLEKQLQTEIDNIKRPEFTSPEVCHPLNFLEELKDFLEEIPSEYRTVETISDCLQGDAYSWAMIFKERWSTIEDFKKDFLEHYWGPAEQNLLRREIICGTWDSSNETMAEHFTSLIAQAKLLTRPIADQDLIFDIISHFSQYILNKWKFFNHREPLSTQNSIPRAIDFLKRLDDELPDRLKRTRAEIKKSVSVNKSTKAVNDDDMDEDSDWYEDDEPMMGYNGERQVDKN